MAFTDGQRSRFRIADTGGVMRDLSAYITEVSGLPGVKGGAMKDHRGGEKLCLSHKSCRHSGCRMSARLGTGRIVDAASRDEPRAGLAVTADTR